MAQFNASYYIQGGAGSDGDVLGGPGEIVTDSGQFSTGSYAVMVGAGGVPVASAPGNRGGVSGISGIAKAMGGAAGSGGTGATGLPGFVSLSYSGAPQATGGAVSYSSGNTRHLFTAPGNLTVSA